MRLIGIAVIALILFAFVSVIVNRSQDLFETGGLQDLRDGRQVHTLETGEARMPAKLNGPAGHVDLGILQADEWNALAGFSGQRRFSLPLLRETAFSSAVLEIFADTELDQDTTGRLRIDVNGQRRGEIVLDPGNSKLRIHIPLAPLDLQRQWVDVSVTVDGNNPKAECTDDWTGGVVVSITPETYVRLALDEPVTDIGDRLIASGSPARIVWPSSASDAVASAEPVISWRWSPFVSTASFVDQANARDTDVLVPMEELVELHHWVTQQSQISQLLKGETNDAWPLPIIAANGTAAGREFRNKTSWVHRYSWTSLPDLELPDQLDLKMNMVSTDTTAAWLLLVTLNGQMIHSETIPASQGSFDGSIALPQNIQGFDNELRISLASNEAKEGRCVQGRPAAASIQPGTQLDHIGPEASEIYAGLLKSMSPEIDLLIPGEISASALNFGFLALTKIFLYNQFDYIEADEVERSASNATVAIVAADGLETALQRMAEIGGPFWVAYTAITEKPAPQVFAFAGDDAKLAPALDLHRPKSALIIAPAAPDQ